MPAHVHPLSPSAPNDGASVFGLDDQLCFSLYAASIAVEEKLRFAVREGGRTVGAGVVAKIIA